MSNEDRVRMLKQLSIDTVVNDIFQGTFHYEDIGHHEDLRNYVLKVDDKYILKIYGDRSRWRGELECLLSINKTAFQTPSIVDFGMINSQNGWILMDIVPGKIMDEEYDLLCFDDRKRIWTDIGKLLAKFHNNNSKQYHNTVKYEKSVASYYTPQLYYDNLKHSYIENKNKIIKHECYHASEVYSKTFDLIEQWFDSQMKKQQPLLVICHNDFCTRNIMMQKHEYGLIDFEMGGYGRPEADFARLALDLKRENLFDTFLEEYYKTSILFKRDDSDINIFIYLKIIEICSWAYKRAPSYYADVFEMLS